MFSSNQILKISGLLDIGGKSLNDALSYTLKVSGRKIRTFQIKDNKLYIGFCKMENKNSPWITYPFDMNVDILTPIAIDFISSHPTTDDDVAYYDGHVDNGWLITGYNELKPFNIEEYGFSILSIEAFNCYYN